VDSASATLGDATAWKSHDVACGGLEPSAVNAHGHDAARADAYPRWGEAERGTQPPSGILAAVEVGFGLPADFQDEELVKGSLILSECPVFRGLCRSSQGSALLDLSACDGRLGLHLVGVLDGLMPGP
jgi:hypothetical protein